MTRRSAARLSYRVRQWLVLALCLVAVAAAMGIRVADERDRAGERERDRLRVQARVIAENIEQNLDATRMALQGLRDELPLLRRQGRDNYSYHLKVRADSMPGVRTLVIINADGTVLASNREELFRQDLSGREYFRKARAYRDPNLLVLSAPYRTMLNVYSMNLVMMIPGRNGAFGGIVVATIDPDYVRTLMASVRYESDMWSAIAHGDGVQFLMVPEREGQPGMNLARPGSFFSRHRESGGAESVLTGTVYSTGDERMVALRTVHPARLRMDRSLVVSVGRDLGAIYAQWRRDAINDALLLTGVILASVLGLALYQRRQMAADRMAAEADAARREAEERYRAVVEDQTELICRFGADGRIVFVNDAFCRLFGRERASLVGNKWMPEVVAEGAVMIKERVPPLSPANPSVTIEVRIRAGSGETRWVQFVNRGIFDPGGALRETQTVGRDITETKQAQEALRESELRFRVFMDHVPATAWLKDATGRYVYANPEFQLRFGDVLGKTAFDLFPAAIAEQIHANDLTVTESQSAIQVEEHIPGPGGTRTKWSTKFPIPDASGNRLVGGIAVDITALRRVEDHVRTLSRAVEHSPAAIAIADREGNIEYVNPRFEEVTGYTRAEMLGQKQHILRSGITPPEVYRELWDAVTIGGEWRGELCSRKKNGELFWEYAALSALKGEDGEITHYIAVNEDITVRRQAEESRLHSQKLESLGTLAGGIAHDFNNVLAAINGNAELALEDLPVGHAARESVAEIAKAGVRAAGLVRRILAFSRPGEHERRIVSLQPVAEEALKLVRPLLPATIGITTRFADDAPLVSADPSQVHEAIVNLMTNAVYAVGEDAGRIEITLETVDADADLAAGVPGLCEGRYACLTVADSGAGMDAATMRRIFDAFFTTKPVGKGTGLGLAMVYGIMKAHGGAVSVESEPDKGASLRLYFPACGSAPAAQGREDTAPVRAAGRRVMYVDDEEALVFLATRVLTRLGHAVTGFTDPVDAVEQFRAHPGDFDVVVTDLSMSRMSGFELARLVRAVRGDIAVVMTTGYVREEDRERAREMGIRDLVLKPNTVQDLGRLLDKLFNAPIGLQ